MAHELEMRNGKASMMYVGEVPWHGLGHACSEAPTTDEAIKLAGLDWDVILQPQYRMKQTPQLEYETDELGNVVRTFLSNVGDTEITRCETKSVVRVTDNKVLGEVGPKWHPLQNKDAFKWFDPILQAKQATLETAGSLYGGKRVFILAKLSRDDSQIIGDDVVRKYVLLSNAHDGTLCVRVGFTPVRVVCNNTLSMATRSNASSLLRIKHHSSINETMEKVREIMNMADATFEATADQYRFLATKPMNLVDFKKYIELIFKPKKEDDDDVFSEMEETESDKLDTSNKRQIKEDDKRKMINKIIPFFENGKGTELKGVRGTMWGGYNALTEYLTWARGRTQDARLDQLWYGVSAKQSREALKIALTLAKTA